MTDLSTLTKAELIALAEEAELDTSGTKADIIARLEGASAPVEAVEAVEAPEPVEEAPAASEVVPLSNPAPKAKKGGKTALPDPEDESLSAQDFVRQCYLAIFGREVDPSGFKTYTRALTMHGTLTREQVIERLQDTDEARAYRG